MNRELQGQANARAQSWTGLVACGKCDRRLAYVAAVLGKDGETLRLFGEVKGTSGSSIYVPLSDKKGVGYSKEEYFEDGEPRTRHCFICLRPECRSATKGRGVISYLDDDELPREGATVATRLRKQR